MADETFKLDADFSPIDKAVAAATKAFTSMSDEVKDAFTTASDVIVGLMDQKVVNAVGDASVAVQGYLNDMWENTPGNIAAIATEFGKLPGAIKSDLSSLAIFSKTFDEGKKSGSDAVDAIAEKFGILKDTVVGFGETAAATIVGAIALPFVAAGEKIAAFGDAIFSKVAGPLGLVVGAVENVADRVTTALAPAFTVASKAADVAFSGMQVGLTGVQAAASATWAAITGGGSLILSTFTTILSPITAVFSGIYKSAKWLAGGIQTAIGTALGNAMSHQQAVGDAWKMIADTVSSVWTSLAKVIQPVIDRIVLTFSPAMAQLAKWLQYIPALFTAFGEVAGKVVVKLSNQFLDWTGVTHENVKDLGNKIQEYLTAAFNTVVDSATYAFTVIETAIQDFPGFMEKAGAKFNLYWEKTTQFLLSAWDKITIEIEHIWGKAIASMQNAWQGWTNSIASSSVFTKIFSKIYGISEEDFKETLSDMQNEQQKATAPQRRATAGQTDDQKKRLAELEKAANAAGGAFNEKFASNLEKNKAAVEAFKMRVQELVGEGLNKAQAEAMAMSEEMQKLGDMESSGEKGGKSGGGGFEDLLALQKRISGAASTATPVEAATLAIPKKLDEQNKKMDEQKEVQKQELGIAQQNQIILSNIAKKKIGHAVAAD